MKAKTFDAPVIDIVRFAVEDIVTTSSNPTESTTGGGVVLPDDDWT